MKKHTKSDKFRKATEKWLNVALFEWAKVKQVDGQKVWIEGRQIIIPITVKG